ncbi:MAG: helix-turn-helix transcriptional regulator, partial [Treponema sp.]|nr:helix-turn-helix transcriptional regulator [Treponema sp.]
MSEIVDLTPREREIFDMLLEGIVPKEIAYKLSISYNTVHFHIKSFYRKLGVHSIQELFAKYSVINEVASSAQTEKPAKESSLQNNEPVFIRWDTVTDNIGSNIEIISDIEIIQKKYYTTFTLFGEMSPKVHSYAGVVFFPDPSTLKAMKKMSSYSFSILGDSNTYEVKISTSDTRLNAEHNHYLKSFTTKIGEITTLNININELAQSPFFGKPVPFIQDN